MRRNHETGQIVLYLVLALAILATLAGLAYKIRESGKESVRLEWAAANEKARQEEAAKALEAGKQLEVAKEKTRVVYRTITQAVDKIVTQVEYQHLCIPDADGLRLVNAALVGALPASPSADKPMSAPNPAR